MNNLRCSLHPTQNIVNFCTRQQCLTQLCPTCIGSHSDWHGSVGTLPHYQNIQQTYSKASQAVDRHRSAIQAQKGKIINFSQCWQKKKQNIFQTIRRVKRQVEQLVQKTFSQIQLSYAQKINEQQMNIGMKNSDKIMKMLDAFTIQSDRLLQLQRDLKTVRGPSAIKSLYSEVLPKNTDLLNRISNDFSVLGSHDLRVQYLQGGLISLKQSLNNLFALQITFPQKVLVRQPLPINDFYNTTGSIVQKPLIRNRSAYLTRPSSMGKTFTVSGDNFYGSRAVFQPKISVGDPLNLSLKNSNGLMRYSRRNVLPDGSVLIR